MISGGVVREPVRGAVDCTTRGEADRTAAGSDEAANTTPGDSGGAAGCTLEGAVDCTSGGAVDCTTRREVEDEKDQDESPLSWGHARRGTEEEHHLDVGDVDGEVEHDDDDEEVELSPEARAFEERWSARRATRGQLKAGPHGEAVRA
jgi:hypothetical protein